MIFDSTRAIANIPMGVNKPVGSTTSRGHLVELKTSHPLHFNNKPARDDDKDDVAKSFSDVLMKSLNKVNDLQSDSDTLNQKMVTDPGSVDIHTVMIAAQKAEIALSFTRAVRDEVIKGYRELMNLR
jgi:flagellar hook-basal body complex protein FliE